MAGEPFTGLTLARVLRPWGRRGQVAAEILTDFPQRLTTLREAWLCDNRKSPQPIRIRSCRIHLGQAIFHFTGAETISDAERFRGFEVQVPLTERVPLPLGRYYISELIGCTVWELPQAHLAAGSAPETSARASAEQPPDAPLSFVPLGVVSDVQRLNEGTRAVESWVLSITTSDGELLIPLASEICVHIDTVTRRIEVQLPEGLRTLNSAPAKLI